jgi:pantoate--beta-alanine ligase
VETLNGIESLRARLGAVRARGDTIALVPTMGNLHEGHLQLVDAARARAPCVVVSIFVNPLQFGPTEDFEAYPRTLAADAAALAGRDVAVLFAPTVNEMYPDGPKLATRVRVDGLGDELCGASRPGHFEGVATVVAKLFNIVQPDLAVFGDKDRQQLTVIRRMVRDLSMALEIVGVPTVRAADGLALSSRNGYLDADARARAPVLYATLLATAERMTAAPGPITELEAEAEARLREAGFEPDYVAIRRIHDLAPPQGGDRELVVLAAARLGSTRLIDNHPFRLGAPLDAR